MIDLSDVSRVVLGAGAFNNVQYGADGELSPYDTLMYAFDHGINAVDTSAYYGQSEVLLGNALAKLDYPRSSYFISTKAGRWEDNTFDYSPGSIRKSLQRSLQRLNLEYVDLLLLHDVEFKTLEEAVVALQTMAQLRSEGRARFIGFSGLPLPHLLKLAQVCAVHLQTQVDAILSYCNLTIQNTLLLEYEPLFKQLGVSRIFNASPLGMSLLRSGSTHDWHPASSSLKQRTKEISELLLSEHHLELADVAEQYAFGAWSGSTVVGCRTPDEVRVALRNCELAGSADREIFSLVQSKYGALMNTIWPSGNSADATTTEYTSIDSRVRPADSVVVKA